LKSNGLLESTVDVSARRNSSTGKAAFNRRKEQYHSRCGQFHKAISVVMACFL
jgi:hypothetical protein